MHVVSHCNIIQNKLCIILLKYSKKSLHSEYSSGIMAFATEISRGDSLSNMANIKSSAKRALLIEKTTAKNKSAKSLMKTNIKKFDAAVADNDREAAESAYKTAVKTVDRAATKNLIHKNKAARRKSAMTRKLNAVEGK